MEQQIRLPGMSLPYLHWHMHNPQDWSPIVDQCYVHCELSIALQEFLGAIQGINKPEVLELLQIICNRNASGPLQCLLPSMTQHLQQPYLAHIKRHDAVLLRHNGDVG
jgi:hypothetical protein